MSQSKFTLRKRISLRAVLAMTGVAAFAAVGITSTADTLAASSDAASANVAQIASPNFFPTPLATGISCSDSGSAGFRDANISWTSAGAGYSYRVQVKLGNSTEKDQYVNGTSIGFNMDGTAKQYQVRVYTLNVASNTTPSARVMSSGFIAIGIYSATIWDTYCKGSADYSNPNLTWENQTAWTPAAPQMLAARGTAGRTGGPESTSTSASASTSASTSAAAQSSTTTTSTSESSSETSVAQSSTTSQPSSASQSSASPSSTTQQAPSKESTPSSNPAVPATESTVPSVNDAKVTFGVGVAGDDKVLLIYRDGVEVCHTALAAGDQPAINGNTVTIQNGNTVKTVDTTTCAVR